MECIFYSGTLICKRKDGNAMNGIFPARPVFVPPGEAALPLEGHFYHWVLEI
jgi:hypothetical protein